MYGLDAIANNNGWAISAVGVSIVFTGLVLLSLSISRIHKLLDLWDNRNNIQLFKLRAAKAQTTVVQPFTPREKASARQFRILLNTMDDSFSLQRLLHMAVISGLEHPHSSLAHLLKARIIEPDDQGHHRFNREAFDRFVS